MGRYHTCSCAAVAVVGGGVDAWRGRGQAVGPIRHHVVAVVHHRCTGEFKSQQAVAVDALNLDQSERSLTVS